MRARVRMGVGTRFAFDGEVVEVVELLPTVESAADVRARERWPGKPSCTAWPGTSRTAA